jgi:DNA-binding MarR family transcriptional regulator
MQHYSAETYKARSSVGYLIKRATALCIECLEPAMDARGFTFTQWVVLMYLRDGLAISAKEICTQLRHDSGAVTRLIDQLEARDFVRRERSLDDRREVKLILTQAGREMVESLIPTVVERLNYTLRDFSTGEVTELTRLLNKFIAGFGINASAGTSADVSADGSVGDAA